MQYSQWLSGSAKNFAAFWLCQLWCEKFTGDGGAVTREGSNRQSTYLVTATVAQWAEAVPCVVEELSRAGMHRVA